MKTIKFVIHCVVNNQNVHVPDEIVECDVEKAEEIVEKGWAVYVDPKPAKPSKPEVLKQARVNPVSKKATEFEGETPNDDN